MSVSIFKISYQVLEPKVQVCYPCLVVLSMVDLGVIRLVFVVGPQYCLFWALTILFESELCSDLVSIDPQPTLLGAKWTIKSMSSYAYCIAMIIQSNRQIKTLNRLQEFFTFFGIIYDYTCQKKSCHLDVMPKMISITFILAFHHKTGAEKNVLCW